MTCTHRLADGSLVCTLPAGHAHGHVFINGSWVADRHEKGDDE